MNKLSLFTIGLLGSALLVISGCSDTTTTTKQRETGNDEKITTTSLNTTQQEQLLYLIQEEKLARDVYAVMYDTRGIKKFDNILNAEENHQTLVANILNQYAIEDPTLTTQPGEFTNTELQNLYNTLIDKGKQNAIEAINVGIAIEEKDIKDIQDIMPLFSGNPDIQSVLQKLLEGSQRHLAAFTKGN